MVLIVQRRLLSILKLSIKWSIIGFILPIIGVIIGIIFMKKNEYIFGSIRRGSALSTAILLIVGTILIYYFSFK